MKYVSAILLVILASATLCKTNPSQSLSRFRSVDGFEVSYPRSWHVLGRSKSELEIISSGNRVHGAVIPRGHAQIIVRSDNATPPENAVARYLTDKYHVDVKLVLRIPIAKRESQCDSMTKVESDFLLSPGADQQVAFFICRIGRKNIVTSFTRWKGDTTPVKFQQEAEAIARSVKLTVDDELR
jgi:hypothetical protein